ncbi:M48 family metalloprotease [Candidatus Saccharibacteria bacterium]|nr:M48 family metalloprotease [Candidatus Saccharibacteria bacterium]
MYKHIAANKRNTIFIMVGFVLFIGVIGVLFAYLNNDWVVAIWFLVIALIYATIQYFAAGRLAMAMTGAKEIKKSDNPRLYNIVENLSITTGMPMPKICVINDPAPNAFATGRDPKHAVVAATTGLMEIMDDKELTAVMAHEMSHVKNYDIRVSMIVFGMVCVIGLISDIGLRMLFFGGSRSGGKDRSPIGLLIALATIILAPIIAIFVQAAVSRQREYLADSSAALITRYPEGMVSALQKLEAHARPMHQQNAATEALFIANPLKKSAITGLFSTHPPLEKRIKRLEDGKTKF